jgi:uncharacterized membrane protein YphA (DoxX/SURF4 family)
METLFILGRVLFGGFFLHAAYGHLMHLEGTAGYAKMKGVPMPKLATIVTGIMQLIGGLSVVTGILPEIGILILLAFMIPTTYMMHQFWNTADPMQAMGEKINFGKNIAIIGALLMMLMITAPWAYSLAM